MRFEPGHHKTSRICYGIELDPRYVDLIIRRFELATGFKAQLVENDIAEGGSD